MLDNRKLLLAVTALAITGVLALFFYSATLGATEVGIADIQRSHEGCIVVTDGTVTDARVFSGGSISLVLSDMATSASVGVFIPADAAMGISNSSLVPGAQLNVRGVLSFYLEKPEIAVSGPGDITLLADAGSIEYGLDTVMKAIGLFDGMEITTTGQLTEMRAITSSGNLVGTSFRLREVVDNQTYCLECMCYGLDLTTMHDDWDPVRVSGTVSYYRNTGCWQMGVEIINPM